MLPAFALSRSLDIHREEWIRLGRHWDDLVPDPYAAELGVRRLRRYGRYLMGDTARAVPTEDFVQPGDSNPLYIGKSREFESLTPAFAEDPVLHGLLALLRGLASVLDEVAEWNVSVMSSRSKYAQL
nr:2OG-Fe dioxygenase family protein [Mycobacterium asiaticum]